MDERVKSGPASKYLDEVMQRNGALLPNPFSGMQEMLANATPQDIAALFAKRGTSVASAAVGNPIDPVALGTPDLNLQESYATQDRLNRERELGEMLQQEELRDLRKQPEIRTERGFLSQFYD